MNIHEKLVFVLTQACVAGGRIFPHIAPNSVCLPYVTYFRVSEVPDNILDGEPTTFESRFQFDCFGRSLSEVLEVAESVSQAFADPECGLRFFLNISQDLHEPETNEYRVMMDYSLWHAKEL
ncbi:MAG: DUF3168 domain-containing protein [Magnetococcus sp. YQC-5]